MWRERAAAGNEKQGMLDSCPAGVYRRDRRQHEHGETERRAPRGVRVIGAVPLGRWETITFVAALRHNKMVAPMVVEGAMTGEMFLAYVEKLLGSDAPAQRHRRDG